MGVIQIQPFTNGDQYGIAEIMAWSFQNKLQRLSSVAMEDMPDFLLQLGVIDSEPFPGYFIASDSMRILGLIVLKWQNQLRPTVPTHFRKAGKYGWRNLLKTLIGLSILLRKPQPGECYIDHVAVSPEARGQGIGTQLILHSIEYATHQEFKFISLHVASDNKRAINLYQKLGFKIEATDRSYLSKHFLGIEQWHYMILPLKKLSRN